MHTREDIEAWFDVVYDSVVDALEGPDAFTRYPRPKITVSDRHTTQRLGTTWPTIDGVCRITVYWRPMAFWSVDAITDLILHELAHVLDWRENGNMGHSATWKACAIRLGALPKASADDRERELFAASNRSN